MSWLGVVVLTLACTGSNSSTPLPTESAPENVAFETILQRSIPAQTGGTLRESARDDAAWAALWARLRAGGGEGFLPAQPPAVDFSRYMVIVAAMETQSCVSRVTVRNVVHARGELVVDLLEAPPAANCICITSERPLHVVRFPRSADPVRFEVARGQTSCG